MGILYARAFTQQALLDAWEIVRDNALADGRFDPAVERFEADAARRIADIAAELAAGEWNPGALFRVEIPKTSGGVRRLSVPRLEDRVVERALLAVLDPVIDPRLLPWSFAYRKGLGTKDAVAELVSARDGGADWCARGDIVECFDRIPRWEVMRRLRELVDDERVVHLVGLLLNRRVPDERATPADRGRGLHQGSVLAPLLSNLYLDVFDRAMMTAGWRIIRYGDDFAIPVSDRRDGERALQSAATELSDIRLELNAGKCRVLSFEEGVDFLGQTVTASTLAAAEMLSHPLETVVYVERQGAVVRTRGDRLVVTDGEESLLRLSLRRVRQVVGFGAVGFTTPFLRKAVDTGIDVVLLSENGTLGGRLSSPLTSDPTARRAQYRLADDERHCRVLAAAFVAGKIDNLRVSLLRAARRVDDPGTAAAADRLTESADALGAADTLSQVLGIEGSTARDYFQSVARLSDPLWGFTGRARRPPPDPINAMLSYGYTLLCHEAMAALEAAGLDPMVGFLHQHRWGRPALALDLIEEFRPMTVDVAVLRCVATAQLRPEQFSTEPDTGCRMGDDAKHTFLAAYERRMLTLITHRALGRRVRLRVALHLQAKALARHLVAPAEPYTALRWK
ncbi:CRISPR-associated endonuclease Cas1 [Nocardia farcinica]|nr:CRISPR-associated endonuclease Cas1 [Nocardia farcinica]MBF6189445.1 CRISPR-associated endonuclease Cas1 [Nocardia farcinica]MBF6410517.1 CRISPR-associated endonuclease Cas1 [Nocardia farcinica]